MSCAKCRRNNKITPESKAGRDVTCWPGKQSIQVDSHIETDAGSFQRKQPVTQDMEAQQVQGVGAKITVGF